MSAATVIAAFLLGGAGSAARFLVESTITARAKSRFPYGTLAVNVSGSFVLGILSGLALSRHEALLLGTATIGAYTTFSAWLLETERLGEDGARRAAAANLAVSLALGVGACALGRLLGGQL